MDPSNPRRWCTCAALAVYLLLFLAPIAGASPTQEQSGDRILAYDSRVDIKEDGSLTVTEIVTVKVAPRNRSKIRHGIYRDFPTKYRTNIGTVQVQFDVVSVIRDGETDDFHTQSLVNGYRVYMGAKETLVEEGTHTYELIYSTNKQLGFFKNHDELYWNVSGDGWIFPKDSITCSVTLPVDVDEGKLSLEAYTGPKGSKGRDFETEVVNGTAHFQTTRKMSGHEDLTVVLTFPKGVVRPPTRAEHLESALEHVAASVIAFIGLAIISCYLRCHVSSVIKHPPKGVAKYRSKPPDGISPAAACYLYNKGFHSRCLASAVVNLCVNGWCVLDVQRKSRGFRRLDGTNEYSRSGGQEYILNRSNGTGGKVSPEEHDVMQNLLGERLYVRFEQSNHSVIGKANTALMLDLEKKHKPQHFSTHHCTLVPMALVAALTILFMVRVNMPTLLDIASWESENDLRPVLCIMIPVATIICSCFLAESRFMKPYTAEGQEIADQLLGFKLYLTMMLESDSEETQHFLAQPREEKMQLFERYLAYAIALNVEKKWTEAFERAISDSATLSCAYHPMWVTGYYGNGFDAVSFSSFAGDVGNSLATTISSSSTAPGSSSGSGGGGSSGGGGGGGGGGGW